MPAEISNQFDALVAEGAVPSRSRALQDAARLYLRDVRKRRLEAEAAKLIDSEEVSLAEESLAAENEVWPQS